MSAQFVRWFEEIDKQDTPLVGGKGANLGEMVQAKFPVPEGFVLTVHAYNHFIKENKLQTKIHHLLETVNFEHNTSLQQVSLHIKELLMKGSVPEGLSKEVFKAYEKLSGTLGNALVAVRSSATAEDLPGASFAGQQETFLNVAGEAVLMQKIKEGYASLFDARAIFYRHEQKFDHVKVGIALVVQKMVQSEQSGIMFTIDPVTNDKTTLVIESVYGLGELIVQGEVTPDHYEVDKAELHISNKIIGEQHKMMTKVGNKNIISSVSPQEAHLQKITDKQIIELAILGKKLEHHYFFPQDSEWAIEKEKIFLVQTRPITTINNKEQIKTPTKTETLPVLIHGSPASPGIATGPAKIIQSAKEIEKIKPGDVLVAPQTNPDFVPAMKRAVAIVTNFGGRTSHAAIVARELGIPAVVGTEHATQVIHQDMVITVNGAEGTVHKGGVIGAVHEQTTGPQEIIKTATKVYVNLAEPEAAERVAKLNVDGVGLLRAEFMMAEIGMHPKKFIHDRKKLIFIEKLAEGLETFCKAFYPRPVIYRASDFKTNEYRNLKGGKDFEPVEPNPMLGYRGAFRYVHDPEVFELELEAIKRIRNKKHLTNLWLMIPFVRNVKELEEVKRIVSAAGLTRSHTFKLFMMVEIPSNVILLDKFIEVGIDGVSIGSNDLTMLLMGTDRDNSEVAPDYDEQNDAALWAFEQTIKTAHKHGIPVSFCGQAVSQYPNLVQHLVQWGITSISISPDVAAHTREIVAMAEEKLIGKHHK